MPVSHVKLCFEAGNFFRLMDSVIDDCQKSRQCSLILRCKSGISRIDLERLEYCEVIGRTLLFHMGTYTVEKDDNLSKISKKLTGTERFWNDIFNANTGIVKEGYLIYPGQVLTIPASVSNSAAVTTPAPAATVPAAPAPAATVPTAPETAAPAAPAPTAPAPAAADETTYTLDYNAIAAWVDGGFIGIDESGSPVVMALNATDDYAIIIFGDNSDMTAASFMGPITYTDTLATITDVSNGMALSFGIAQISDDTLALDMGEIGVAAIQSMPKEDVLATLKLAIENYKHVA